MAGLTPFNYRKTDFPIPRNLFNMMDDFFNDSWPFNRNLMNDTFKVDVKDSDDSYIIEAEMPGIKKEEIYLSLNDERLNISIKRNEEVKEEKESYIHKERRYSSMQRSIYLADAFEEGIDAKLEDGILKITIPKRIKSHASKQIEIK